jgi:hypothetical protein
MQQSPRFSASEWIQVAYPDEPDWSTVPDQVLIELVRSHSSEQSCATIAIDQLDQRGHAQAKELARWLLEEPEADQWLKQSAIEVLNRGRGEAV